MPTTDHCPLAFPPLGGRVSTGEEIDMLDLGWFWLPPSPKRKVVRVRTQAREGLASPPSEELREDRADVRFASTTSRSSQGQWEYAELNSVSQATFNRRF